MKPFFSTSTLPVLNGEEKNTHTRTLLTFGVAKLRLPLTLLLIPLNGLLKQTSDGNIFSYLQAYVWLVVRKFFRECSKCPFGTLYGSDFGQSRFLPLVFCFRMPYIVSSVESQTLAGQMPMVRWQGTVL